MRVIGLDLSCDSTGVALPDGATATIKAPKPAGKKRTLTDDLARLHHIDMQIRGALLAHAPHLAVIEDYTPGIRSAAAHRLAEVGGVVRLACHDLEVPVALVNTMWLKKYATGSTKAEKRDMALAAFKRFGVEHANDDECDAWWLRQMGLDAFGRVGIAMPKDQRGELAKIAWPTVGGHQLVVA